MGRGKVNKMKVNARRFLVFGLIVMVCVFGVFAEDLGSAVKDPLMPITPSAPKFTTAERHRELAARRKRVADQMDDDSMLILFSADPKLYTNDVNYVYRQENNLYYLTALKQNNATLVMTKKGGDVTEFVFLRKRIPAAEVWNGKMYSNEDAVRLSGIKKIVDARFLRAFLESVEKRSAFEAEDNSFISDFTPKNLYLVLSNKREFRKANEFKEKVAEKWKASPEVFSVRNAYGIFSRLRHIKSPYELKLLQHAIDITGEGLGRSMGVAGRANWEYEVHAELDYTFRRRNADFWGFPSIVGCGPNATTLHYVESQGKVTKGDLLLMDVGAEYDHYTADVTRTFPVNGKFTERQAEIYQIVYDAQEAAAAELKPGSTVSAASRAARRLIEERLLKLGLITELGGMVEAKFRGRTFKMPQSNLWFMHGWGHWLGMNVHDVGNKNTPLKPGMVTTNEPGIYVRSDALDNLPDTPVNRAFIEKVKPVYEKYKNIGVRIEDDMLVTEDGVDWMTKRIPRSIKDIENFMEKASRAMSQVALKTGKPKVSTSDLNQKYRFENFASAVYPNGETLRTNWTSAEMQSAHRH